MSAVAELANKRDELAQAEAAFTEAKARHDTDAAIAAVQRIHMLCEFIADLTAQSAQEVEDAARDRAAKWLAGHPKRVKAWAKDLAAAQDAVREAVTAMVAAIHSETRVRAEAGRGLFAADVLARRFELAIPAAQDPRTPFEDWAAPVQDATTTLHRTAGARVVTVAVAQGSTPEQRRRAVLRAVAEAVRKSGGGLPTDVRDILDSSPIPSEVLATPARPMGQREQGVAERMAREVREAEAALGAGRGATTGLARGL